MLLLERKDPHTAQTVGGMTSFQGADMGKHNINKTEPSIRDSCGTTAGYKVHSKNGEKPCSLCSEAWRARCKDYYLKNREAITEQRKQYVLNNRDLIRLNMKAYYKANSERLKAKQSAYYAEHREEAKEYARNFRVNNPEKTRRHNKNWMLNNSIKKKEYDKQYRIDKPHIARQTENRRRARKLDNGFEFYTEVQVIETYGTYCYICHNLIDLTAPRHPKFNGWEMGLQIDHWIPLSKGGPDTLANVRPSHGPCNLNKGDKIL